MASDLQVLDVGGRLMPTGGTEHVGKSIVRSRPNLTSTSTKERHYKNSADKNLWSRVLRLAIIDALGASALGAKDNREQLRAEALQWILSPDTGPSSFRWTCGLFNLSPVAVMQEIATEARRRTPDKGRRRPMGARLKYWTSN